MSDSSRFHPALEQQPEALKRLGAEAFVTMPVFRRAGREGKAVYVNVELLEEVLAATFSRDESRRFVEENLALSFEPPDTTVEAPVLEVFVDRQADPMNMSLNGNLGSGRAAYVGAHFNLKGLGRTVLAVSRDPNHSNGSLDLVSALWEMICANVLRFNLRTGTAPVLAVIDLHRLMKVPWKDYEVPAGLLVRLDLNGELDRPTHLFQKNQPVSKERLLTIAARLGTQDAEKFIERILHGCWSAGNVSLDGHLIDYDTVFAVRHRAPQWSYRPNWISDFFGLEGEGQKKLLKSMADHAINGEKVSWRTLFRQFDEARKTRMEERFRDLLGLPPDLELPMTAAEWSELVRQFEVLSQLTFPNLRATAVWEPDNNTICLYDVSRLLRLLPIWVEGTSLDDETRLRLIRNPMGSFITSEEQGIPDGVRKKLLRPAVASPEQAVEYDRQALVFVRAVERVYAFIERQHPDLKSGVWQRAYAVNEERTYMNCRPGNDALVALVQQYMAGNISRERLETLLVFVLRACDRLPRYDSRGRVATDYRLFLNGCTSHLIDSQACLQPKLTLLTTPMNDSVGCDSTSMLSQNDSFWCEYAGHRHEANIEVENDRVHVFGPRLPLRQYLRSLTEDALHALIHPPLDLRQLAESDAFVFGCGRQRVRLVPLLRTDREYETGETR